MKQLTIVGAGWAGLAAAVAATQAGWQVQIYEASAIAGGRARSLPQSFQDTPLDNGQHVLIGAYRHTLALMRTLNLDPNALLWRLPLDLRFSDGSGIGLPNLPMPLNVLVGIVQAKGWSLRDKVNLMRAAWRWQLSHFECDNSWTVAQLCDAHKMTPHVVRQLIEPLCLSALNTPIETASASVLLRVLHDALLECKGSSDLLIPRTDLGALMPNACLDWLKKQGAQIHLGTRISASQIEAWHHANSPMHVILLACPPWEAARLTADIAPQWAYTCAELTHNAIATVYMRCHDANFQGLPRLVMALHSDAQAPAQFVFDRGTFNQQSGLLAAVVSDCTTERDELTEQVHDQVCEQLGLTQLEIVQTVIEKRATFACTPLLDRPEPFITQGLWACGDYICGPYPATIEGAVRSGQEVITQLGQVTQR